MIKQIKDNPEYFISDAGEVFRVQKLKPVKTEKGYLRVMIRNKKTKKRKFYRVHRLVIETFEEIELRPEDQINHFNKIRHDNNLSNLEIVTALENAFHRDNYEAPF